MQGASEGGGGKDDIYMYFVAIRNGLLIFSVFGVKDVFFFFFFFFFGEGESSLRRSFTAGIANLLRSRSLSRFRGSV